MPQTDERLQIRETQDRASSGEHDKGGRWGKMRPGVGKRANMPSGRVMKEHPRLTLGKPLSEEGKLPAGKGMERMSDREEKFPIRIMGCR
jgi:hypothetical protein